MGWICIWNDQTHRYDCTACLEARKKAPVAFWAFFFYTSSLLSLVSPSLFFVLLSDLCGSTNQRGKSISSTKLLFLWLGLVLEPINIAWPVHVLCSPQTFAHGWYMTVVGVHSLRSVCCFSSPRLPPRASGVRWARPISLTFWFGHSSFQIQMNKTN
jgi:hypothetical protein